MALLPERFIAQVLQATDIVDVVSQFVALRKAGKDLKGLCPFHDDHNPSMSVVPAKQIFKCFVCGAGGSVIQFLMLLHKSTFPDAVKELAERAGIPIPEEPAMVGQDKSLSSEALNKLMLFAARFFREKLSSPEGAGALAYATARKITEESIARFGLGFATAGWEGLKGSALRAGFTDKQLVATGMAIQREDGGCYDRFRNRLMFPIISAAGKIVGFGGRALDPEDRAKYLNSPETVLFDKSSNLYGLNWARQSIIETGQAVVVEGYLDTLMPMQAGVDNVVATLGTALTERHVRMLSRYAKEVVLVYDADAAGQAAAERAIELFLSQQLNVRIASVPVIDMPDGGKVKDPCDYVLTAGADAFRQVLAQAPDAMEFAWIKRSAQYRAANTLAAKRTIVDDFLRLIVSSVSYGAIDTLRQGLLAEHVAQLVGMSQREITQEMRRLARTVRHASLTPAPQSTAAPVDSMGSTGVRAEAWLLGALMNAPELFTLVEEKVTPEMFIDPLLRAVAQEVWRLAAEGRLELQTLLSAAQTEQWGQVVTDLQSASEKRGNFRETVLGVLTEFDHRITRHEIDQLRGGSGGNELLRRASEDARTPNKKRLPKIT